MKPPYTTTATAEELGTKDESDITDTVVLPPHGVSVPGVLALLGVELSERRNWPVVLVQVLLITGIIVTSALDLRDLRHRQDEGPEGASSSSGAQGRSRSG